VKEKPFGVLQEGEEEDSSDAFSLRGGVSGRVTFALGSSQLVSTLLCILDVISSVAFSLGSSGALDSTLLVVALAEIGGGGGGNALLGGVLVDFFVSTRLALRTFFLSSSVSNTPGKKT